MTASVHVENELDRQLRICRETELANIANEAAQMRDVETNIDKALTKLDRFLSTLTNLAVEVQVAAYRQGWRWTYFSNRPWLIRQTGPMSGGVTRNSGGLCK